LSGIDISSNIIDKEKNVSEGSIISYYKNLEARLRSNINLLTNKNYVLIEKNFDLYEKISNLEKNIAHLTLNQKNEKKEYVKKIEYLEAQMQKYMECNAKLKEKMENEKKTISMLFNKAQEYFKRNILKDEINENKNKDNEVNNQLNITSNKFENSTEYLKKSHQKVTNSSIKGKLKSVVNNFLTANDKTARMSILKEREEQRKENLENFEADGFVFNIVTTNNEAPNMNNSFYVESGAPKTEIDNLQILKMFNNKSASKQVISDQNSEFDKIDNDVTQMLYEDDGFEKMCKQFNIK